MPRRRKYNYKYPCLECKQPVKKTQEGMMCDACDKWVHLKCTDLTLSQYDILVNSNEEFLFFCLECKPRQLYADFIFENPHDSHNLNSSNPSDSLTSDSEVEFSDANSADFTYEYVDGSDSDSRGLDFDSLPVQNVFPCANNSAKLYDS